MKLGYRKFFAFLLVFAGIVAVLVLHFLAPERAPARPNGFMSQTAYAAGPYALQAGDATLPRPARQTRNSEAGDGSEAGANHAPLPAQHQLEVPALLQLPELPNGCEATSLAMVLQFYGYEADKVEIAEAWLPRQAFAQEDGRRTGGNPELVYVGDPADAGGYYCFPKPLADAATRYLVAHSGAQIARDESGATEEELLRFIANGIPVLVWITTDLEPPRQNIDAAWEIPGQRWAYIPYSNLHVVVLTGYDGESFTLNDPNGVYTTLPRTTVMELYTQMGSRALVVAH